MTETRAKIFFSGVVQGVGFRFTSCQIARSIGLTGRVRNLPDGRVEMEVEGRKDDIASLCEQLDGHFSGYIKDKDITFGSPRGEYTDFQISH